MRRTEGRAGRDQWLSRTNASRLRSVRRRVVLLGAGTWSALFWISPALAQQTKPPVVIGWLAGGSQKTDVHRLAAFKEGLAALGWKEGSDYLLEERWSEGKTDTTLPLAKELAAKKPSVIVTSPAVTTRAVAGAAPNVPIVQANGGSLINSGLAKSQVKPGGMVTGIENRTGSGDDSLTEKYVEMLVLAVPKLRRVGFLASFPTDAQGWWDRQVKIQQRVCAHYKLECRFLKLTREDELESAFAKLREEKIEALVGLGATFFTHARQRVADRALKEGWPLIAGPDEFAQAGALMSYGSIRTENFRRAAYYVDKILKGAKPGDLPIEQSHRIELTLNLKTANALGLTLPPEIRVRADRVIK
jgi:putative ABC transport system substrate-binding protein